MANQRDLTEHRATGRRSTMRSEAGGAARGQAGGRAAEGENALAPMIDVPAQRRVRQREGRVVTEPSHKLMDSIHARDGLYCVDVISTPDGFSLQTCRRDEGRWQVIARPGAHGTRVEAIAAARAVVATFDEPPPG